MDKSTGHIGQQINGIDETVLLKKIGGESYHDTSRRPGEAVLKEAKLHESDVGQEVPTWRMTLGDFVRTYPEGQVFINDYKVFPNLKQPIKTICESILVLLSSQAMKREKYSKSNNLPSIFANFLTYFLG